MSIFQWFVQFGVLIFKCLSLMRRSWVSTSVSIIIPIIWTAVFMALTQSIYNSSLLSNDLVNFQKYWNNGNDNRLGGFENQTFVATDIKASCNQFSLSAHFFDSQASFSCVRLYIAPVSDDASSLVNQLVNNLISNQGFKQGVDVQLFSDPVTMSSAAIEATVSQTTSPADIAFTYLITVALKSGTSEVVLSFVPLTELYKGRSYFNSKTYYYLNTGTRADFLDVNGVDVNVIMSIRSIVVQLTGGSSKQIAFQRIFSSQTLAYPSSTTVTVSTNPFAQNSYYGEWINPASEISSMWAVGSTVFLAISAMRVVNEKRLGLLTQLRQLGMMESTFWFSHWITMTAPCLLTSFVMEWIVTSMAVSSVTVVDGEVPNFDTQRFLVVWLTMCAASSQGLFLASFTSRPVTVNIFLALLIIISILSGVLLGLFRLSFALSGSLGGSTLRYLLCFFPLLGPTLLQMNNGIYLEIQKLSPQLNATETDLLNSFQLYVDRQIASTPYDSSTTFSQFAKLMRTGIANTEIPTLLIVSCVIYYVLAWYFAQVFGDRDAALQLPWYFVFTCSTRRKGRESKEASENTIDKLQAKSEQEKSIIMHKVSKTYSTGGVGKTALREFSLTMHQGQVYVILGQNGAGKSTLIKVLSGAMEASHGHGFVFGHSIKSDMSEIHCLLAMCMQDDIVWPELTAYDHVRIHTLMRRDNILNGQKLHPFIMDRLKEVSLEAFAHKPVGTFSGGMRRRLSVVLACLIRSGPGLTILDEPCTGVDTLHRRQLWQLMQQMKQHRTVILTTHDLAEAEALGDHICIMSQGSLKASGSSLFLKKNYGAGYQIKVQQLKQENSVLEGDGDKKPTAYPTPQDLVKEILPDSQIVSNMAGVLTVAVDRTSTFSIRQLFQQLQKYGREQYDWSVSNTTLEQVFLRLCEVQKAVLDEAAVNEQQQQSPSDQQDSDEDKFTKSKCTLCHKRTCDDVHLLTMNQVEIVLRDCVCQSCIDRLESEALGKTDKQSIESGDSDEEKIESRIRGTATLDEGYINTFVKPKETETKINTFPPQAPIDTTNKHLKPRKKRSILRQIQAIFSKNMAIQRQQRRYNCCLFFFVILVFVLQIALSFLFGVAVSSSPFMMVLNNVKTPVTRDEAAQIAAAYLLGCATNQTIASHYATQTTAVNGDLVTSFQWIGCIDAYSSWASTRSHSYYSYLNQFGTNLNVWSSVNMSDGLTSFSDNQDNFQLSVIANWTTDELAPGLLSSSPDSACNGFSIGNDTSKIFLLNSNMIQSISSSPTATLHMNAPNTLTFGYSSPSVQWYKLSLTTSQTPHQCNSYNFGFSSSKSPTFRQFDDLVKRTLPGYDQVHWNIGISTLGQYLIYTAPDLTNMYLLLLLFMYLLVLPVSSISFVVVQDRVERSFDLMVLGGLNKWTYWLGTFLFHFLFLIAPNLVLLILLWIVKSSFVANSSIFSYIALTLLQVYWMIGWSYWLASISPNTRRISMLGLASLIIIPHIIFVTEPLKGSSGSVIASIALFLLPSVPFANAWMNLLLQLSDPMPWIALFTTGTLFLVAGIVGNLKIGIPLRSCVLRRKRAASITPALAPSTTLDEYVQSEQSLVQTHVYNPHQVAILVNQVTKQYHPKASPILNQLSLAIGYGEVFGLLGPNGCGKTTLLNMIQGHLNPSLGQIHVGGNDTVKEGHQLQSWMGVCPQFDALWPDLTVYDHFILHARLRGATVKEEQEWVQSIAEKVGLDGDELHSKAGGLSGGQKRRLSIGIALLGQSPIILLDEPTTGVDVESRQFIWSLIDTLRQSKEQSIVLTTHALEEAEALCSRIGIVAGGQLRCLGPQTQLKRQFGKGFKLRVLFKAVLELSGNEKALNFHDVSASLLVQYEQERLNMILQSLEKHMNLIMVADSEQQEIFQTQRIKGAVQTEKESAVVLATWLCQFECIVKDKRRQDLEVDYAAFFMQVETWQKETGVIEWALHQASLEDVFCRIVAEYV